MNRLFSTVLICLLFACKNESGTPLSTVSINKNDSLLRMLTYGLPDLERATAYAEIAKQYHFCYYAVAGCVVTKELIDSVNRENAKVNDALAAKYGSNWKQEFTRKSDSLSKLLDSVRTIISKESFLQKNIHLQRDSCYYHISPAVAAYVFNVETFSTNTGNPARQFSINLQTQQVELIK